jgi:hypothetical protein
MQARINSLGLLVVALIAVVGMSGAVQAGLVSYWTLDDNAANTTLTNSVNATYNAVLQNTSNVGQNTSSQSVSGKIGTAINFNSAYYGAVNNGGTLQSGITNFTVSLWEYDHTTASGKIMFAFGNNGGGVVVDQRFQFEASNQSVGLWMCANTYNDWPGSTQWSPAGFNANTWHHILITYDSTNNYHPDAVKVYRDGILLTRTNPGTDDWTNVNTHYYSPSQFITSSMAVSIGAVAKVNGANQAFDKPLDDVALWDTVLSGAQIKAICNLGNSGLNYGAGAANDLFTAFGAQSGANVGGKTWYYQANGLGGSDGDVLDLGGGNWAVNLGGGAGMTTVPEPSTLALLAAGLAGLLAYAWRKRR